MSQTLLEEESADDLWYPPEDVTFIVQHHLLLVQKRANTVTDYVLKDEPERVLHSVRVSQQDH